MFLILTLLSARPTVLLRRKVTENLIDKDGATFVMRQESAVRKEPTRPLTDLM